MKCVPVHYGIPAVLHRDEPWLHRHSENGALKFSFNFKAKRYNVNMMTKNKLSEPKHLGRLSVIK